MVFGPTALVGRGKGFARRAEEGEAEGFHTEARRARRGDFGSSSVLVMLALGHERG